jgi:hypothetical protein
MSTGPDLKLFSDITIVRGIARTHGWQALNVCREPHCAQAAVIDVSDGQHTYLQKIHVSIFNIPAPCALEYGLPASLKHKSICRPS